MTTPEEQDALQERDAAEKKRRKAISSHDAQMADAMAQCVPCKLCGGKAIIADAGPGHGYYIECEKAARYTRQSCLQSGVRISGWAYNVSDLWNRLNAPADDVTALRARVAELEAFIENDADWKFSAKRRLTLFREQRARAESAEAKLARRGQGVRVRPLAWKRDGDYLRAGPYVIEQTLYTFYIRYGDEHIYPGHKTLAEAQSAAQADYEARIRAALVSPGDGWRRCDGCRAVGAIHCAHPDECGNMKHVNVADLIAQADSWQSWLDDLPLPDDFREGINDCQQYIADLSYALQPQPAPPASEGADHG